MCLIYQAKLRSRIQILPCETINVQVVADFVTITFYRKESENSIVRRELIPSHAIEHIWVKDLQEKNL